MESFYRLINPVQRYHWGTKTDIATLLNRPDLIDDKPIAEYWIGSHPSNPSRIADLNIPISELLKQPKIRGPHTDKPELPFLLKLLSAQSPLSIQVHPNKAQAQIGYDRETAQGIALDDPIRNYKDANHKPETLIALTPFKALAGFRETKDIQQTINRINAPSLNQLMDPQSALDSIINVPDVFLKKLMLNIFNLTDRERQPIIDALLNCSELNNSLIQATVRELHHNYKTDAGVLMPLLLNVVVLQPGQSIFLYSGMPHAYLAGTGIEIMATSDNVLRAGLTPKHIDLDELFNVVNFSPSNPQIETCDFSAAEHQLSVPVPDYRASIIILKRRELQLSASEQPELYLVIDGQCNFHGETFHQGESFLLPANTQPITLDGKGYIVRVYSPK